MRYHLHIRNGETLIEDMEGAEFLDHEAARREAVASIRDLLAEMLRRGDPLNGQSLEIWDETGRLVERITFRSQLRPTDPRFEAHAPVTTRPADEAGYER